MDEAARQQRHRSSARRLVCTSHDDGYTDHDDNGYTDVTSVIKSSRGGFAPF